MALIGTLRNKMGTWVVVFVFVAIVAFILTDLLGNNTLFNDNSVGEIAGHTVSLEEFQQAVQEREANYVLNFGRQPGEREMATLRQQAWELLILRHAVEKQYDKVGINVPIEEEEDMIYGRNVDENIKQAFTNPETGEFDKNRLLSYLKELNNPPADPQMRQMWQEQRTRWEIFQRDLRPGRERLKYENLLVKTNYVTSAEAEREYHLQNDVAEIKYLYVPYYTVSDSAAQVSDSDIEAYYNENKERYKTEESRDLKYVAFSLTPTAEDSLDIREEMEKIANDLQASKEDSAYAAANTDGTNAYGKFNVSSLPQSVQNAELKEGNVIGPFVDGNAYKVVKISRIYEDTVFTARASHILIKWDNETDAAKKAAKEKARGIIRELKSGASFAAKARENSADPGSASRGGDLGWFSTGRMVKPFEDAVFGANKPGLLNDVVETDYGYHIISVTNVKDNVAYEIATVEREIGPSDVTANAAYRKAEAFAADLNGQEEFVQKASKEGFSVQDAKNVSSDDRRAGNLGDARQVVQWAFRDASVGDVSEVFDLQTQYVVAVLTNKTDQGYKSVKEVREQILPEVRKKIKGEQIIEKLKGTEGTLEELASKYGSDANVYSSSDLKLNSNSLPSAGFDPKAVGVAFSLENGKRSHPFRGENGVFIIETQSKTVAPELAEYSTYKTTLQQNAQGRSSYGIAEAIKDHADIEDERYKFY